MNKTEDLEILVFCMLCLAFALQFKSCNSNEVKRNPSLTFQKILQRSSIMLHQYLRQRISAKQNLRFFPKLLWGKMLMEFFPLWVKQRKTKLKMCNMLYLVFSMEQGAFRQAPTLP